MMRSLLPGATGADEEMGPGPQRCLALVRAARGRLVRDRLLPLGLGGQIRVSMEGRRPSCWGSSKSRRGRGSPPFTAWGGQLEEQLC